MQLRHDLAVADLHPIQRSTQTLEVSEERSDSSSLGRDWLPLLEVGTCIPRQKSANPATWLHPHLRNYLQM